MNENEKLLLEQFAAQYQVRADMVTDIQRALEFAVDALTPLVDSDTRLPYQTVVSLAAMALIAVNQAKTSAAALVSIKPDLLQ